MPEDASRRRARWVRVLRALTWINALALAVLLAAVLVYRRDWPQALLGLPGALWP